MSRNTQMLLCDIQDALKEISYDGPMLEEPLFKASIQEGSKNVAFTEFISFLTNELRVLCNVDECVNKITSADDSTSFLMEISSFLKEIGCPYVTLTEGHMSDRLATEYDKLLLIDYLLSELMAARMVAEITPNRKVELKVNESSQAADLKNILISLKFQKPPPNITAPLLFQKLKPKIQETVQKAGSDLCGKPIFVGTLSDSQWKKLTDVHKELNEDYKIRREMLLKRLDVTIQSFQWSNKTKGKEDTLADVYFSKRVNLKSNPNIDLSDLLAARDDLAIIEKTSSASVRKNTRSSVNKVMIGSVPDRGGRPSEQAPPPPEMPSWQQRQSGGDRGGGRGGRGGRGQNRGQSHSGPVGGQNFGGDNQSFVGNQSYVNNQNYGGQNYGGQRGDHGGGGNNYKDNYSQNYQQPQDRRYHGSRGGNQDLFEPNRSTYVDQYVQDNQQNQQHQQYRGRGGGGGGNQNYSRGGQGRSNYNRGGYR